MGETQAPDMSVVVAQTRRSLTAYIAAIAGSLAAKDCDGSDGNESDHGAGGVCDGAERDCDGSRGVHSGAVEEPVDGEGDLAAEEGR